jgi:hypothetical protein
MKLRQRFHWDIFDVQNKIMPFSFLPNLMDFRDQINTFMEFGIVIPFFNCYTNVGKADFPMSETTQK